MMSVDLFEKIIPQVAPLTDMVTFHLMGEPLVHPDLEKFVQICEDHQTKIFFVTNGFLLKDHHKDLLTRPIFHQVNFSLHSFFDNYPEKSSDLYLKKIFEWTDHAMKTSPDMYINFRLWNLAGAKGQFSQNQTMLQEIEKRYGCTIPKEMDVTKEKSVHISGKLYLHFDTEFVWPSSKLPSLGTKGKCYGLSSHFGIHADGTIVPCCLDKEADIKLGDAKSSQVLDVLTGERAQNMVKGFKNRVLVEDLCQKCNYITRFN